MPFSQDQQQPLDESAKIRVAEQTVTWLRKQGHRAHNYGPTVAASKPPVIDETSGLSILKRGMLIEPQAEGWLLVSYLHGGKKRESQLFETAEEAASHLHGLLMLSDDEWRQTPWCGQEV